ncbi:MAG: hypothetical protein JWQ25_2653 [Daejeonella sp.]|nr:hypothetical protein [Daejeonella sp.]
MKKSIGIIAVLLLSNASLFAAVPAEKFADESAHNVIKVEALHKDLRVGVSVDRSLKGKSFVTITDKNNNLVFEDFLTGKLAVEKAYNLSELENGDYTIAVTSNETVVKKTVHIYDEAGKKTYFFFEN